MNLYKYISPDAAIRILTHKEITASKPSSFNDPFELIPSLRDYDVDVDILIRLNNPAFLYRLYFFFRDCEEIN